MEELEESMICLPDCTSACLSYNQRKNRYSNNLPLEATRVRLNRIPGIPGSDYINASFVQGIGKRSYIAAQAPLANTVADFWRMVHEHNIMIVIMLTRLEEDDKVKAMRYWPSKPGNQIHTPTLKVVLDEERSYFEDRDDIIIRHLRIIADGDGSSPASICPNYSVQQVVQLHYQAWPDFGCPPADSFNELLRLMDRFKLVMPHDSPILAHCSAGLGRTGSLIAAHISLEKLSRGLVSKREDLSAREIVKEMRKQRPGLVQSREQYAFVCKVIDSFFAEYACILEHQRFQQQAQGAKDDNKSPKRLSHSMPACRTFSSVSVHG